jgi:hypothetical protein
MLLQWPLKQRQASSFSPSFSSSCWQQQHSQGPHQSHRWQQRVHRGPHHPLSHSLQLLQHQHLVPPQYQHPHQPPLLLLPPAPSHRRRCRLLLLQACQWG